MKRLDMAHPDTTRLAYDPQEAPDDQLDLTWAEWRWIVVGFLVAGIAVLLMSLAGGGPS